MVALFFVFNPNEKCYKFEQDLTDFKDAQDCLGFEPLKYAVGSELR
jgi:hypothetical protein